MYFKLSSATEQRLDLSAGFALPGHIKRYTLLHYNILLSVFVAQSAVVGFFLFFFFVSFPFHLYDVDVENIVDVFYFITHASSDRSIDREHTT